MLVVKFDDCAFSIHIMREHFMRMYQRDKNVEAMINKLNNKQGKWYDAYASHAHLGYSNGRLQYVHLTTSVL